MLTLRELVYLQQMSGNNEKLYRIWTEQEPESFFAHLNAGLYYVGEAFKARGNRAASEVRDSQWETAKKISQTAQTHLNKAMTLMPDSALPHSAML